VVDGPVLEDRNVAGRRGGQGLSDQVNRVEVEVPRPEPVEILLLDLGCGPAAIKTLLDGLERGVEALRSIRAQIAAHESRHSI
jgi:hypothetical protein